MKLKAILSGLTLVLFCSVGFAQTEKKPMPKKQYTQKPLTKDQAVQQQKIKQGVKSGELTKKESTKLRA